MTTAMATPITTEADLGRLLAWTSPAYPIGGFSYSHGIEMAVEVGALRNRADLVAYIAAVLADGAAAVDGPLLAAAWRAAQAGDAEALDAVAVLAAAFRGTAETALESLQQGDSFARITQSAWPDAGFAAFVARHPGRLAHAVAFGAAAGFCALPLRAACYAYLSGFVANLVSAGVRLVPLGQTDGQIATAALIADVARATDMALTTALEEIGSAAPMLDLFSMAHETQYTRLFRS
ncbi:urease accessory protein [Humitalea rosea]|uniref:Urease accessory protein UreF n=2 Tax=Humitalea rosea TaxID=990373 RepID=A0A2W7IRK6_9PROT|nr:urease accessory protein [Humitalea rosea]